MHHCWQSKLDLIFVMIKKELIPNWNQLKTAQVFEEPAYQRPIRHFKISDLTGGGGGIRTHVRKPSDRSSYMLIPSFVSRLIRRLGESSGIGQPGFSRLPAPDEVGKTSLMCDVPSAAQAPAGRRASLN